MSYLDVPRLQFGGTFYTDPSTINNVPDNYLPGAGDSGDSLSLGWNPNGVAEFYFRGCRVWSAVDSKGRTLVGGEGLPAGVEASDDPVLESAVKTPNPYNNVLDAYKDIPYTTAKLVDLDPDQQGRSAVYGLWIVLQLPHDGDGPAPGFHGLMSVPNLHDMGQRPSPVISNTWSYNFGGVMAGVIGEVEWVGDISASPLLSKLKDTARKGAGGPGGHTCSGGLSVKLVVDLHRPNPENQLTEGDQFCYGRVQGAIGPALEGEAEQYLSGRYLQGVPASSRIAVPCLTRELEDGAVLLSADLSNSLELKVVQGDDGQTRSLGELKFPEGYQLGWQEDGAFQKFANGAFTFKGFEKEVRAIYKNRFQQINSCMVSFPLEGDEASRIAERPLELRREGATLSRESSHGLYIGVRQPVARLEQGHPPPSDASGAASWDLLLGPSTVHFEFLKFGAPVAGEKVDLPLVAFSLKGEQQKDGSWTMTPGAADIGIDFTPETDSRGLVAVNIEVKAAPMKLSPMRTALGSRMNFIVPRSRQIPIWDGGRPVSVLVWREYEAPASPTWDRDVAPIMQEYAKIYPGMKGKLNIANQSLVAGSFRKTMIEHLSRDPFRGDFMPVTRDLTPSKIAMIVGWLEKQGQAPPPV